MRGKYTYIIWWSSILKSDPGDSNAISKDIYQRETSVTSNNAPHSTLALQIKDLSLSIYS